MMVIYSKPTAAEGDKMLDTQNRTVLQMRQQAYDNQQPEETPDEHEYTGEIHIEGMIFQYCQGNLEDVVVPGYMFERDVDRTALIRRADDMAMQLWLKAVLPAARSETLNRWQRHSHRRTTMTNDWYANDNVKPGYAVRYEINSEIRYGGELDNLKRAQEAAIRLRGVVVDATDRSDVIWSPDNE